MGATGLEQVTPVCRPVAGGVRRWFARGRGDPARLLQLQIRLIEGPLRRAFIVLSGAQNRPEPFETDKYNAKREALGVAQSREPGTRPAGDVELGHTSIMAIQ